MLIAGEVMFSQTKTYKNVVDQLDRLSTDTESIQVELCNDFIERIKSFYWEPAAKLLELNPDSNSFAAGVILLTMVDAMSVYSIADISVNNKRYKEFLKTYLSLTEGQSKLVYDNYRNGLIHEGRIKSSNIFKYDDGELISPTSSGSAINTKQFLLKCEEAIQKFSCDLLTDDVLKWRLVSRLKDYFQECC